MKIYWDKIPKFFTQVAMNEDKMLVAYYEKPIRLSETWEIGRGFKRRLIEHEEYELDGTEDWTESLQERPKEVVCSVCGGRGGFGNYSNMYGFDSECAACNGTGVEP